MITQEELKEYLYYDKYAGDFHWIKKTSVKSSSIKPGAFAGCIDANIKKPRCIISFKGVIYYRYRLAFLYIHGYMPKYVDHINGNSLDDRIDNLRDATSSLNNHNTKHRKTGKLLPGVVKWPKSKGYYAGIQIEGKWKYLGSFLTENDAGEAYLAEKRKLINNRGEL